jgi:Holliday junction DNA helicase RuvA
MIASLRGIVQSVGEGYLVLDVGGVGLQLAVPRPVLEKVPAIGRPMYLHTQLVVREDSLRLFGFGSPEERAVFQELLQVSGVGPRTALAILSTLTIERLQSAVASNQVEVLTEVPGIGKKTAEKILFQLKDRIAPALSAGPPVGQPDNEVIAALTGLGYSLGEAQSAVRALEGDAPEDVGERIKLALQYFARP